MMLSYRHLSFAGLLLVTATMLLAALSIGSTPAKPSVGSHEREQQEAHSQTNDPTTASQRARIRKVHSVEELRAFCNAEAVELKNASWVAKDDGIASIEHEFRGIKYTFEAGPVCIDSGGIVRVDHERYRSGQCPLCIAAQKKFHVRALTDEHFRLGNQPGYAEAVPAVGVLTIGLWIATHLWHLLHDCLEALVTFFQVYNSGEMWKTPTQTVLLRQTSNDWVDRYGDTLKKMDLSAQLLNTFSSPFRGGPFYRSSLIVKVPQNAPPEREKQATSRGRKEELSKPLMHCFCQAMMVTTLPMWDSVTADTYYAIQDLAPHQFGEYGYLHNSSLSDDESRRINSRPWAQRFWRGEPFTKDGQYRPRALYLHRKSRLIGNTTRYVNYLRELDFRVEEIFPEKFPLVQQYHLARYTDLLVGMHGLGIGHGYWMNRFPIGCRTIVEFRPWVHQGLPIQLHRIMGRYMGFNYKLPKPINVTFGDSVRDKVEERRRLLDRKNTGAAWSFPGFTDQVAHYDDEEVKAMFRDVRAHLDKCLPTMESASKSSPLGPQLAQRDRS